MSHIFPSTYLYLVEERQSAASAILNSGHIPAGMELFIAAQPGVITQGGFVPEIEIPVWFISFCTALLAAFFGSMLTIRKFKKEKIWQEKYQAYRDVLSALEAMLLWADETYCDQKMIPTKGTGGIEGGNWPSFAEARRVIAKTTCIGKIFFL